MGYVVRHSTSNISKTRRRGKVVIGTNSDGYEKTSSSGLYNGVPPVEGKHNIVRVQSSGDPDFYALNDVEIVNFANQLGGSTETVLEAQNYLLGRDDIVFTDDIKNDNSLRDGLRLDLNSRIKSSFLDNEPITNLVSNPLLTGDNPTSGWGNYGFGDNNFFVVTNIRSAIGGGKAFEVVKNTSSQGTVVKTHSATALSTGDKVTVSFYVKGIGDTIGNNVHIHTYASSTDGAISTGTTYSSALEGGWKKFTHTYTWTKSVNSYATVYSYCRVPFGTGEKFLVSNPQVVYGDEPKNFINGSRSQNTTWYDLSGYGNNFTPMNNMSFTGHSFDFNGVNSGVQDTISSYNPDGADSVLEVLFKPMDLSGQQAIFSDNYGPEYGFWIHTNGKLRAVAYASVYADLEVGKWYHAVMNINPGATKNSTDQTYVQLYLNGEYIGQSNANTGNGMNDQPFTLGYDYRSGSPTSYFSGSISLARVYYGDFTQEEVSQNYYGGDIVTNGLVFAIDAGNLVSHEEGNTIAYSLTGSYSGSFINGPTYSSINGGAVKVDGSNDYILVNGLPTDNTWTIQLWSLIKTTQSSFSVTGHRTYAATDNFRFQWDDKSTNIAYAPFADFVSPGGNVTGFTNKSEEDLFNKWNLVTMTCDGSNVRLYFNGDISPNTTGARNFSSDGVMRIGIDGISGIGGTDIFNRDGGDGYFGPVMVYDRALSHSEVLQNYNAHKARFT